MAALRRGVLRAARLAGVTPKVGRGQKSTNYEPTLQIVRWVKTPPEFETPPEWLVRRQGS